MKDKYLRETRMVDFSNPAIQKLIQNMKWKEMGEFERIKAIYNYVRDDVLFGYNIDDGISNFSTFNPAFLQHFMTTSLVGTRTSPCPHIFARGISNVFISHTNTLLSLVTSLRISLPFGRRHLFTLSKNACGLG